MVLSCKFTYICRKKTVLKGRAKNLCLISRRQKEGCKNVFMHSL